MSATLDGVPWSGNVQYSIHGPYADIDSTVPHTFISVPSGRYTVSYDTGGPAGAVLTGISPTTAQTLTTGGEVNYILNFSSNTSAGLFVNAYYDGAPWAGPVSFSITGPISGTYASVPLQLGSAPSGTYRITYQSGGPPGTTLGSVTPDAIVTIVRGRSGGFTLNYYTETQTGSIVINATLNGTAWSGAASFAVSGPSQNTDYEVPRSYTNSPIGRYTVTYMGGGPSGSVFSGITPATTQLLSAGRSIMFNLNFTSQPSTGSITVYASVDGQSWQTNPGSGPISYTLTGPYLAGDRQEVIPGSWTQMPSGAYSVIYNSGGPIGATLTGISPAPTQNLGSGGSIIFTLNFTSQNRGYVTVDAELDGQPWSGSVDYVVTGPYVESGDSVSMTFSNVPKGSYSVHYTQGGPYYADFAGVSPSSQQLSPGGAITFTIMFNSLPGPGPMPGPVPNPTPGPMPGPVPNPNPDEPMPGPVPNPTPDELLLQQHY